MTRRYETSKEAWEALEKVRNAVGRLKHARELLLAGRAKRAAKAVSRALKSAEGATRHAERVYHDHYYDERRREGTA